MPAFIVTGSADREVYRFGSSYLARELPDAELLEVPDAGHDPHRSHAAVVNAAIGQFAQAVLSGRGADSR